MLTEDHLIRMINLALAALARIVGLRTAGQYEAARFLIEQTLEQLFGLKAYMLRSMDDASFLALLRGQEGVDPARGRVVADLLQVEGDVYLDEKNRPEAMTSYRRALALYLEIGLSEEADLGPELAIRMADLLKRLPLTELDEATLFNLAQFAEQVGALGQAERALLELADRAHWSDEIRQECIGFYERALARPESELAHGNVDRQALQARLQKLR